MLISNARRYYFSRRKSVCARRINRDYRETFVSLARRFIDFAFKKREKKNVSENLVDGRRASGRGGVVIMLIGRRESNRGRGGACAPPRRLCP